MYNQKQLILINFDSIKSTLFTFLCLWIALAGISYLVLVKNSIFNIVYVERAGDEITKTTSAVSDLEYRYMYLKNGINMELAGEMGFAEDLNKIHFAGVGAPSGLSLLSNER
ncbi:MAG: hypothetical protein WC797_02540 [Candidatus Paceibacterota bacterium]|jgi:hypothetical protein